MGTVHIFLKYFMSCQLFVRVSNQLENFFSLLMFLFLVHTMPEKI